MSIYIPPELSKQYEEAIIFLVSNIEKTGHNPKPVILHSLSMAFYLLEKGYEQEIIESAILHDLVEDSDVKIDDIEKKFGLNVAKIVASVSYDETIKNWTKKYQNTFHRVVKNGRNALIVKASDIYFNSFYIRLVEDKNLQAKLVKKMEDFLKISKELIGNEKPWKDLQNQFFQEKRRIKNNGA